MRRILVDQAIQVIDNWLAKGKSYMWASSPEEVKKELEMASDFKGEIDYNKAINILLAAQTSKLRGDANKGIVFIKEEWKKLKYLES